MQKNESAPPRCRLTPLIQARDSIFRNAEKCAVPLPHAPLQSPSNPKEAQSGNRRPDSQERGPRAVQSVLRSPREPSGRRGRQPSCADSEARLHKDGRYPVAPAFLMAARMRSLSSTIKFLLLVSRDHHEEVHHVEEETGTSRTWRSRDRPPGVPLACKQFVRRLWSPAAGCVIGKRAGSGLRPCLKHRHQELPGCVPNSWSVRRNVMTSSRLSMPMTWRSRVTGSWLTPSRSIS